MLSVDAVNNVPPGYMVSVLHCLASQHGPTLVNKPLPPSGWHAARHPNWDSSSGLQQLKDGFASYYSVRFDPRMCIFFQVRAIPIPSDAGTALEALKQRAKPASQSDASGTSLLPSPINIGWGVLPVFDRRCEGYVRRGAYMLPLFTGDPPPQLWPALQQVPEIDNALKLGVAQGGFNGSANQPTGRVPSEARGHGDGSPLSLVYAKDCMSVLVRLQDPQFHGMLEVADRLYSQEFISSDWVRAFSIEAAQARAGSLPSLGSQLPDGLSKAKAEKFILRSLRTLVAPRKLRTAARAIAAVRDGMLGGK